MRRDCFGPGLHAFLPKLAAQHEIGSLRFRPDCINDDDHPQLGRIETPRWDRSMAVSGLSVGGLAATGHCHRKSVLFAFVALRARPHRGRDPTLSFIPGPGCTI